MHQIQTVSFIGGGNMAQALVGGLLNKDYPAKHIWITEPVLKHLTMLEQRWGVQVTTDNNYAVTQADVVILAVKPQILRDVCVALRSSVQQRRPLLISIAAGMPIQALQSWLGDDLAIVRCMPNTPALVTMGATGLFANANANRIQRNLAEQLLQAVGITAWLDREEQIDAITALSGSGPAYFFYFMDAIAQAGIAAGLPAALAQQFILQTALGAASLAQNSPDSLQELCHKVTSPNGTTARALEHLNEKQVDKHIYEAVFAAHSRAQEMAQEYEL